MKIVLLLNFDIQLLHYSSWVVVCFCMFEVFYIKLLWKIRETISFQSQQEKTSRVPDRRGLIRGYFFLLDNWK